MKDEPKGAAMIKDSWQAMMDAARRLVRDWQVLALFGAVYAVLLTALYFFSTTREASVRQVLLTLLLALLTPALFFILQAMGISYTRHAGQSSALLSHALRNFWKLMLVSLPLILLACLMAYLFGKLQTPARVTAQAHPQAWPTPDGWPAPSPRTGRETAQSFAWSAFLLTAVRCWFYGLALPLAAIHLWLAAAREGLVPAYRSAAQIIAQAFAPQPVLIYTIGSIIFGIIPCALIFTRTPAESAGLEVGLLVARVVLSLACFLFGWIITLGALAETSLKAEAPERALDKGSAYAPA